MNKTADAAQSLAVYVHWPFCRSKCPYCDFNSHVRESIDEAAWLDALCRELDHYAGLSGPRGIGSIFFGGGTPSLMSARTVEGLIDRIGRNWSLPDTAEITLEANPTSVEAEKFRDFAAAGVNRVSLGIQSLRDDDLRALGREHSVAEAKDAIALAQKYFRRNSFDLIYARMGQTVAEWERELQEALDLAANHLSLYQLTMEKGTPFHAAYRKGQLILPDEDASAEMYDLTREVCAAAGLPAYEVSNHAAPGEESRHNMTYWTYGDYIGIGPGAHGRLTVEGRLHATCQRRKPEFWLRDVQETGHATEQDELLDRRTMAEEMIMMGLRLSRGIALAEFQARIGDPLEDHLDQSRLEALLAQGYLDKDAGHLRVTGKGAPLLNYLLGELLA
ncbi:radical SAM family heme chaperone HemW [Emcibacter nanhaiensis]|uniref:Heme chaperone HemW n=1 Tax=Emcibacter nanhaiensis TaxID=1505037 RepID=A0A501PHX7_9PROT|nr:radical SAM family heme chaperone HemW [Emcibacter nanhaiensis]TPD59795.1 coproporphyrinogen III oxidase [Emcibacter nanhaiensis]